MGARRLPTTLAIAALSLSLSACGGNTKTVTVIQTATTPVSRGESTDFPDDMYTTIDASCAFIQGSSTRAHTFAMNVVSALNTPQAPGPLETKILQMAQRICRKAKNPDYTPGTEIVSELVVRGAAGT
jgi:hypothetical protein